MPPRHTHLDFLASFTTSLTILPKQAQAQARARACGNATTHQSHPHPRPHPQTRPPPRASNPTRGHRNSYSPHVQKRMSHSNAKGSIVYPVKLCATCGRQISWRKKWEKNWSSITHCSQTCRSHKIKTPSLDTDFEVAILDLLRERRLVRGAAAVVTCEEVEEVVVARYVLEGGGVAGGDGRGGDEAGGDTEAGGDGGEDGSAQVDSNIESKKETAQAPTRTRERCRQAARRLAGRGEVVVTQKGKVVDPSFAKGVMELKLPST